MESRSRSNLIVTACLAIISFSYILYRALSLNLTHDEAYTYTRYVQHTYSEIATYQTGNILPNNHLLNTFSQKYFAGLLGPSEFSLRLLSIISSLIFLVSAFFIARMFTPTFLLPAFIVLTLHPYILDFMMLSRGYGPAMAFMLLSIFGYLQSISNKFHSGFLLLALLSEGIAVLANFSWLTYFVISAAVYFCIQLFTHDAENKRRYQKILINAVIILIASACLAMVIYTPLMVIIERKLLFGGQEGFWKDTVGSLADRFAYGAGYKGLWMLLCQALVIITVLTSLLRLVYVRVRTRFVNKDFRLLFVFGLLVGMIILTIVQVIWMHSYYPQERTALFFVPPFLVLLALLLESTAPAFLRKISFNSIAFYMIAGALVVHMLFSANFRYVLDWKYDSNSKEIVQDIEAIEGDILLGVHPFFQPSFEFYRRTLDLRKFGELHVDGYKKEGEYDHYVIPLEDRQKIEQESLTVIKEYSPSEAILTKE